MSMGKANKYFNDAQLADKKNLSIQWQERQVNSMQNMHDMNFPERIKNPGKIGKP